VPMLFLQEGTGTSSRRNPFISNVRLRLLVTLAFSSSALASSLSLALSLRPRFRLSQSTDEVSLLTLLWRGSFSHPHTICRLRDPLTALLTSRSVKCNLSSLLSPPPVLHVGVRPRLQGSLINCYVTSVHCTTLIPRGRHLKGSLIRSPTTRETLVPHRLTHAHQRGPPCHAPSVAVTR
jgi:hypothetical protein